MNHYVLQPELKYAPTRQNLQIAVSTYRKELSVDLYELTMSQVFWRRGMDSTATFSLFFRGYPNNRSYYVANGIDQAIDFLEDFHFEKSDIEGIREVTPLSEDFLELLSRLRFTGNVRAVREGTIVFADEPLIEVTAPIIEAQIVETMLLNILTSASLFATKASRIVQAAASRPVVDFGTRRTHSEESAVVAARAGYIAGFAGTSNLKAAAIYDIPAFGTMAHSFVQAFGNEKAAFEAYANEFPDSTTLLVDTYDSLEGVRNAIRVAQTARKQGVSINAIRLDSGDLAQLARDARSLLDQAGFPKIEIMASGGLDEHRIADYVRSNAPIDAFGVGTRFGTSADAPYIDSVYKLVELDSTPIIKLSVDKQTLPWAKQVYRRFQDGQMSGDIITASSALAALEQSTGLLHVAMRSGKRTVPKDTLKAVRERVAENTESLDSRYRDLHDPKSYPVEISAELGPLQQSNH